MTSFPWPLRVLPRIRVAGHFPLRDQDFQTVYRSWFHALHVHDYAGVVVIGGERCTLGPGSLTLSPAGRDSSYHLPVPGRHWCIHFEPVVEGEGQELPLPLHLPLRSHHQPLVERIRRIATLHARGKLAPPIGPAAAAAASAALQELLMQVALLHDGADDAPRRTARSDHVVERLLSLIQERLDQPLDVAELAADLGLSQNHLARCFRKRCGCTIQRYLIERRVERARMLLTTTSMPIAEIGAQVGMPDPQHFNKQFRRSCGLSPSRVRAEAAGISRPPRP